MLGSLKILIESRTFYPAIGGLETVSQQLAEAWQRAGHQVRVITRAHLGTAPELNSVPVLRQPSSASRLALGRWCDVFVQSGISLRSLWMPFAARRPVVFIHHGILRPGSAERHLLTWLKVKSTRLGHNVAVSRAVAEPIEGPTTMIPNPFSPHFERAHRSHNNAERAGLLFVGRLVSEKGCDVALEALKYLRKRGRLPHLTICGDGPERAALERRVRDLDLLDQVTFAGWAHSEEVAGYYARAAMLLTPSRNEAFGLAALEALAAGCPVVASAVGGLPDAVGPGGRLVPPDDPRALASAIEEVYEPGVREGLIQAARDHLDAHSIDRIAGRYLEVLEAVAR